MNKSFIVLIFILFAGYFLIKNPQNAYAACDPPECSTTSQCAVWGPNYHCSAKCCVADTGSSGGGGGSSTPVCPSNYTLVFPDPKTYYCAGSAGGCKGGPGAIADDAFCGGPCANAANPTRVCCSPGSCQCLTTATPTGMSVSGINSCTNTATIPVTLSWNAVSGATSYAVRVDNQSNGWNGSCSSPNSGDYCFDGVTTTSVTVNLPVGTAFGWWVHGVNACGAGSATGVNFSTCTNCTPAGAPTGMSTSGQNSCTNTATIPITFRWNATAGATSYYLRIDDKANSWLGNCGVGTPNPGDYCIGGITGTSYTMNLPISTNFQWFVSSFSGASCQSALGAWISFATCSNPTPPPTCVTGAWANGACGGGTCTNNQRQQTRTVTPAGCATNTRCIADAACLATPTPTPAPTCTSGAWSNTTCGGGACTADQMQQTRTVNPAGCVNNSRCIADASCVATPTPGPTCSTGAWSNTTCGGGACTADQMQQTRTVTPAGCAANTRCVANAACAATPTPVPVTCTITGISPDPLNLLVGQTDVITATVSCTGGSPTSVQFVSNGVTFATVSPATDSTPGGAGNNLFTTNVTGINVGSTTITATPFIGATGYTSRNSIVNVTAPAAWWRVEDSDIATNGNINSTMPSGELFNLTGGGGFPGIPAYGNASNLTGTNVSSNGWLANSSIVSPRVYDYDTLSALVPADAIVTAFASSPQNNASFAGTASYGYTWYRYTNPGTTLNLNGNITVGTKKIILLVDGNLKINGNINLSDGSGFFMAIVKGNITIDSAVGGSGPNLEGIYISNGTFNDSAGNSQLYLRGSVVSYGGVNLQRDLEGGNSTTPAEFFEFAPDQIMLYPSKLGLRRLNWKEVAP